MIPGSNGEGKEVFLEKMCEKEKMLVIQIISISHIVTTV